jgi:hypothetical protein
VGLNGLVQKLAFFLLVAVVALAATLLRSSPFAANAQSQRASGSPPFITSDQSRVLIEAVDIDQTLIIADREVQKGGFASVLTLWGIRDQVFTEEQAKTVSSLYFRYVDRMDDYFRIWHFTWAISNIYRNGNSAVRAQLEPAYLDATKRARAAGGVADAHVNGPIVMGDIHLPARSFVRAHVVATGTRGYLQSLEDYRP